MKKVYNIDDYKAGDYVVILRSPYIENIKAGEILLVKGLFTSNITGTCGFWVKVKETNGFAYENIRLATKLDKALK
jgi:hypothetical protein